MNITRIPDEIRLNISSFLVKDDMHGFRISCKELQRLIFWNYDDYGVHICLGCDLTGSMYAAYDILKPYLIETITNLKKNPYFGRIFASVSVGFLPTTWTSYPNSINPSARGIAEKFVSTSSALAIRCFVY